MAGMEVKYDADINIPKALAKIENNAFWTFAATEWWKLYTPYVPRQSGELFQQVVITPKMIEHTVPYSVAMYNGNFDFNTNKHPFATGKWDIAAINAKKNDLLIKSMQTYADSGRLKLSD